MVKYVLDENELRLGLQFFAGEDDKSGDGKEDQDSKKSGDAKDTKDENKNDEPKTYTTEELQTMMAKEKRQGKASGKSELLKELGIEDVEEFKKNLDAFNKYQESQKTAEEKANDKINQATKEKTSAEEKLKIAEAKVEAMKKGVNPEYVDDVITLALAKKTDEEELSDVIESMKETHKMYFENVTEDKKGTGNLFGDKKSSSKPEGIGEILGKKKAEANKIKSSYFRN